MSAFENGEEVVTVRLSSSKFNGLVKAGLITEYELLRVSIIGETFDNPRYKELSKLIRETTLELDELRQRLKDEQNTTSGNTD